MPAVEPNDAVVEGTPVVEDAAMTVGEETPTTVHIPTAVSIASPR